MIKEIMKAMDQSGHAMSLSGLSVQLEIEESALEGILHYLVQKGKIKASNSQPDLENINCDSIVCSGCGSFSGCLFTTNMPQVYTLNDD